MFVLQEHRMFVPEKKHINRRILSDSYTSSENCPDLLNIFMIQPFLFDYRASLIRHLPHL